MRCQVFVRKKRGLLSKVVPLIAIASVAQAFMKRRRPSKMAKLIGTASIAALALQKSANRSRYW